jgi:ParB family chromosome partitioning protein
MGTSVGSLASISKARKALAAASKLEDVLSIRDQAEALRVYMRAAAEGFETSNAAAEIKLRAERKAGAMLAAMEKNPGHRIGGNKVLPPASLDDLGIDKMQSSRWQKEASVSEQDFEQYLHQCLEHRKEVTQSGLLKIANGLHISSSGENEWYTPSVYIEAARAAMGSIDLDPASCGLAQETVQAGRYYTIDEDGLERAWDGNVWLNPPYSKDLIGRFAEKVVVETERIQQAIVLVNNATETAWFQSMARKANAICLFSGRIKFNDKTGKPANTPVQGQVAIYFGENVDAFESAFCSLGLVVFID